MPQYGAFLKFDEKKCELFSLLGLLCLRLLRVLDRETLLGLARTRRLALR